MILPCWNITNAMCVFAFGISRKKANVASVFVSVTNRFVYANGYAPSVMRRGRGRRRRKTTTIAVFVNCYVTKKMMQWKNYYVNVTVYVINYIEYVNALAVTLRTTPT